MLITTTGTTLSTVTCTDGDVVTFPAPSVARTASECAPFVVVAVFQLVENGALVSVPTTLPSTRNCTDATPLPGAGSELSAVIVIVPETVPPLGLVTTAAGGVLSTATVRLSLLLSPAVSYAVAVSVCGPSPLVVHDTEYGAVESVPMSVAPS